MLNIDFNKRGFCYDKYYTSKYATHWRETQVKNKTLLTTNHTNLHEIKPVAVDFIAVGNIIHRRRVFMPQALKQTAISTTDHTEYTE